MTPGRKLENFMTFRNQALKYGALAVSFAAPSAFAVAPDLSSLSGAVDFTSISTAILAIALLIVPVYVVWKGAKIVLRSIKGM